MKRCYYLGPRGTHSEEAAEWFAATYGLDAGRLEDESSIEQVLEKVNSGRGYGCIPLENSIQGSVTVSWDTLRRLAMERSPGTPHPWIMAAYDHPIHHHLLLAPEASLARVKVVLSHPQALHQCRRYLERELPHAELTEVSSTARAADIVKSTADGSVAGIASRKAGESRGLRVSSSPIEDSHGNSTRFGLICNTPLELVRSAPASGLLSLAACLVGVENLPGGLYRALQPFHNRGLNLSRIESRPVGNQLGNYFFYVDVSFESTDVREREQIYAEVVHELKKRSVELIPLGLYTTSHKVE